jgi:glycosyltransferase involved in cell wall biosynthesis
MAQPEAVLIIPAYNEAANLAEVLSEVSQAATGCEVVVVDDGSQDATAAIARRAGARVLRHPFNLGYGAALQTGYKYAVQRDAALVVQMDADGQHDPGEIRALLEPVRAGECDLLVGSRFLESTGYRHGLLRTLGRQLFRGLVRLAGLRVSDPTSGFQAMNRKVLDVYTQNFFPADYPDVDVLLAAYRHGLRVAERPVHMKSGLRGSTLHGGLRPLYYTYKMILSTWCASASGRGVKPGGGHPS